MHTFRILLFVLCTATVSTQAPACQAGQYRPANLPANTPYSITIDITKWSGTPVDGVKIYNCIYLRQINLQPAFKCTPDMVVHWCANVWLGLIQYNTYLAANEQVNPVCYRNFRTDYWDLYQHGESEAVQYLLQPYNSQYTWCADCNVCGAGYYSTCGGECIACAVCGTGLYSTCGGQSAGECKACTKTCEKGYYSPCGGQSAGDICQPCQNT